MIIENLNKFASVISKIQKTDRWSFLVCDGEMGEGKSAFTSQLAKEVAKINKTPFTYKDNMSFQRKELKTWIDGDEKGKNQKPEYTTILADEIVSMFFKRNWYDAAQIDGIELLNKCRDRHLFILGNIPNFWDIDSALFSLISFRVHIYERGRAWVFEKDKNPFTSDKWHKTNNEKIFRKMKTPYKCNGFVCEIRFNDWSPADKKEYYAVRNKKRVGTEGQRGTQIERYGNVKKQRDEAIKYLDFLNKKLVKHKLAKKLTPAAISEITGLASSTIAYMLRGYTNHKIKDKKNLV